MPIELDPQQHSVLDAYRERKGRFWKQTLGTSWETGRYGGSSSDEVAVLQGLRNTLGPEWLTKYQPPKPAPESAKSAGPYANMVVGYWGTANQGFVGMVGIAPPVGGNMVGSDRRRYIGIDRHEPFDTVKHAHLLDIAAYGVRLTMDEEQRDFIDRLTIETKLGAHNALSLSLSLGDMAAKHLKLAEIDLNQVLNEDQKQAQDAIEGKVLNAVSGIPGIKGAHFTGDPRGATVGIKFESGASNSLAGGGVYKVPVDSAAYKSLDRDFWSDYVAEEEAKMWAKEERKSKSFVGDQRAKLFEAQNWTPDEAKQAAAKDAAHFTLYQSDETERYYAGMDIVALSAKSSIYRETMKSEFPVVADAVNEIARDSFKSRTLSHKDAAHNGSVLVLEIDNTVNAAFVDLGRSVEIARIVDEAARKVEQLDHLDEVEWSLRDLNGNRVGAIRFADIEPVGPQAEGTLRVVFGLDNDAFRNAPGEEAARVLRTVAHQVKHGHQSMNLLDSKGSSVGSFAWRPEVSSLDAGDRVDLQQAFDSGDVYWADDSTMGIANGEFRFVVPKPDFEVGYGQGTGDVWLVNAKGDKASGYEDGSTVRETDFRELRPQEKATLDQVLRGEVSFDAFESRFREDAPQWP